MVDYCGHLDDEGDFIPNPKKYKECKTAFCLAGYANLIRLTEEGFEPLGKKGTAFGNQFVSEAQAAKWLGMESNQCYDLFHLMRCSMGLSQFDELPADIHVKAAISCLEHVMETGAPNWHKALVEAGAIKE